MDKVLMYADQNYLPFKFLLIKYFEEMNLVMPVTQLEETCQEIVRKCKGGSLSLAILEEKGFIIFHPETAAGAGSGKKEMAGFIKELYVLPAYRQGRVGDELVKYAESVCA